MAVKTVKQFVAPVAGIDSTLAPLPTYPMPDAQYSDYSFGGVEIPVGYDSIASIKLYYRREFSGDSYLRFRVSQTDTDTVPATETSDVDSLTAYTVSSTDDQIESLTVPTAAYNGLTFDVGDVIAVKVERDASDALDTYTNDFNVAFIEFSFNVNVLVTGSERLSKDYTSGRVWAEAIRDTDLENVVIGERFMLVNRAVSAVVAQFPFMWNSYMTVATESPASGDSEIDISTYRIYRPALTKIELESSQTDYVEPVSLIGFRTFRSAAHNSRKKIVYAVSGEIIYIAKGDDLSSYGTITFRYPRVPTLVTADTDLVDLPDGEAVELAIIQLKKILAERYEKQKKDYKQDVNALVQGLYSSFGVTAEAEEHKSRIKALA